MNIRVDRSFNWNFPSLERLESRPKVLVKPIAQPVAEQAAAKAEVPQSFGSKILDIGASLLKQQLQTKVTKASTNFLPMIKRVASVASVPSVAAPAKASAPVETFNPNAALGFFSNIAGGFLGNLASSLVGKVVSKIPESVVKTGMQIGSAIFGGESGKGIDAETKGYLESFGLDPRAVSAARLYFNTPNGIKGYATTIGDNIHFGDRPEP